MTSRDFRLRLHRRARRLGVQVPAALATGFQQYFELLMVWNRKINLTSIADPDDAIDRLLLEPLAAARHFPSAILRLIDLGSGGGSPALPLKLARPEIDVTMVESKTKKAVFLQEAIRQLGLHRVRVEHLRIEELLARPDMHEIFDAVTVRAVRMDGRRLLSVQAFLKAGGLLYVFRGLDGDSRVLTSVPPLMGRAQVPLLEPQASHLAVFQKVAYPMGVPRGTVERTTPLSRSPKKGSRPLFDLPLARSETAEAEQRKPKNEAEES